MERLIDLINKELLSAEERKELLDSLYWTDWSKLNNDYPNEVKKIFTFLRNTEFNEEEIALIQKLYNNPDGAYVEEFSYIISKLYREDKIKFLKALHLAPEEGGNLAYLFRNKRIIENVELELEEILKSNKLTNDELLTTSAFFRTYENLCKT